VAGHESDKPNIVLILIDDMGWKDTGVTGSEYYQTPNIDELAAEGMLFTRAYSAAPVCAPSRGAILTGKYPARTKYTTVIDDAGIRNGRLQDVSKASIWSGQQRYHQQHLEGLHRHLLPLEEITFAEHLQEEGYATGYAGKWHGGLGVAHSPKNQGFDYAEGYETSSYNTPGHFGRHCIGKVSGMTELKPEDNMADALTDLAVRFIETNKQRPFAFMLSHWAVHTPLQARPEEIGQWQKVPTTDQSNPAYAAMVESVDRSVGTIVDTLDRLGLSENTLIVFTSDNGGLTLRNITSNYPLLGGKSFPYEAGMRVPFIVRWPARVTAGATNDTPVVGMDIHTTLLDCAGLKDELPESNDGVSLKPLLLGEKESRRRPLFFHYPHYTHATGPFSSVVDRGWKLIRFYNDTSGSYQLFHLGEDPYEQHDLADSSPERREELIAVLDDWPVSIGAELPRANPEFNPELPPTGF